jgi:serine/tyrosine/threonine adenylyltransferase
MLVGFIHGVMNTDNMAISGETIDYGPCAFMDAYDPATVFSSIDESGRYAYGNQPIIAQWNLARFAEALLPLIDQDKDRAREAAVAILEAFPPRFHERWSAGMAAKLGLHGGVDDALVEDLLVVLQQQRVDYTSLFRALAPAARGDAAPARALFSESSDFDAWSERWRTRMAAQGADPEEAARAMDRVNPVYIPRNHLVEEALAAATEGDMEPFRQLVDVLAGPFEERPRLERYAQPAPLSYASYQTFCGT